MKTKILSILLIFTLLIQYSFSQKSERIGIIDMEYILSKMEDYTIASQQLEEKIDWVVAPQVTSPLREASDISKGITLAKENIYDSFFSCSVAEDLFFWQKDINGELDSVNYDWRNRKRRQDIPKQYIENGSFYLFKPEVLRDTNNRFGSNIGLVEMEFWKMFEIDSYEDLKMCSALMREFIIK